MARAQQRSKRGMRSGPGLETRRRLRPIAADKASVDLADALGASRTFSVSAKPHGPFGVAALLAEVRNRLISRGGRPADPSPTVRRLVPVKKQVWRRLQTQARHLSDLGKPVSPGQLAALLLERTINELEIVEPQKSR